MSKSKSSLVVEARSDIIDVVISYLRDVGYEIPESVCEEDDWGDLQSTLDHILEAVIK